MICSNTTQVLMPPLGSMSVNELHELRRDYAESLLGNYWPRYRGAFMDAHKAVELELERRGALVPA